MFENELSWFETSVFLEVAKELNINERIKGKLGIDKRYNNQIFVMRAISMSLLKNEDSKKNLTPDGTGRTKKETVP